MIDMSMERIRAVIDKACQDGKNYATIEKRGTMRLMLLLRRSSTAWAIK